MRKFNMLTSSFLLATALASNGALAVNGGDNSGGGNTLNQKLIEQYYVDDLASIPGGANFEARMAKVRQLLPTLGDAMQSRLGEMDWYLIPAKISQLPAEKTGLHFNTEQPIYQTRNEVFVSESGLKAMDQNQIGALFIHEGVMALHEKKFSDEVRPVVVRLLSSKATPENVQSTLLKFNFGAYFTDKQMAELVRDGTHSTVLKNALFESAQVQSCTGDEKTDAALFQKAAEDFAPWTGNGADLSRQITGTLADGDGGDVWSSCGYGIALTPKGTPACLEVNKIFGDEELHNKLPNYKNRKLALDLAGKQYLRIAGEQQREMIRKLAESNAYLTVMALAHPDANESKDIVRPLKKGEKDEQNVKLYKEVKAKIDQRRAQIDFTDKAALARLRCNSVKALAKEYHRLAPKDVQEEYPVEEASSAKGDESSSTGAN
jgi:hypothetical protein